MRTVTADVLLLTMTSSVAQWPSTANTGSNDAPLPPTPLVRTGSGTGDTASGIIGTALKFTPRKRIPTTEIATDESTCTVPVNSAGRLGKPGAAANKSEKNWDTWRRVGI